MTTISTTTSNTTTTKTLYIALELGEDKWLLACATEAAQKPRVRSMPARDLVRLGEEIAKAKSRFNLPADAPVGTCYEAGRDGFWLHRALTARGIDNLVVDSSSIEVNRRHKHVKSDPVWLRWQPGSKLSQWYERRFGLGNQRMRKIGIVALARKVLIALWHYVEHGELPEGAEEKDWRLLVDSTARRHAKAAPAAPV